MKKLILSINLVIAALIVACSPSPKNNTINKHFYKSLNEQLSSGYFSPLKFANQNQLSDVPVQWSLEEEKVLINKEAGTTKVNLTPIQVSYSTQGKSVTSSYSFKIYDAKGVTVIDKLFNPITEDDNISFSTNDKNVSMVLNPSNEYLKWEVIPANQKSVDSIVIDVKTKGPFYGGGERYIGTRLDGRTISNQPNDHYWDPPWDSTATWANRHEPGHYKKYEPTYLQIPFIINPNGQAWYIDNAASIFMTFSEAGDQFSVRIEGNKTDFYTIIRNSPKEALNTYTSMIGRQPVLPDWATGVWVNLLDGPDSVYAKANRLKEWGIPATAIWVFDMYDIESSQGYQHWTTGTYPDLRGLTDSLHSLGFKVLSYLHPYQEVKMPKTEDDNPMYLKLDSLGIILNTPDSIRNSRYGHNTDGLYDFHKPLMGDIWADMIDKILVRDNFDGYMEDFGDLSYYFDRELITWNAVDYGQETPLTPNEYNNTYPLIYHKLSYLHANAINKDIATFCRSGSAGSAAYTKIVWGGDQMATWNKTFGYPSVISSGISCGLSGYGQWAPDILCDSKSMELWKRWVQFAAFTPIFRDHLWVNKPTSIDLWTNKETREYFKRYAQIHLDLEPYIKKYLAEYQKTGTPIIRHMMLEFPNDIEGYSCEYQYMFGPEYLVAPVVEKGDTTKDIYFPKGKWKSYWNSETIESSGKWITVNAPIDKLPVYKLISDIKQ